MKKRKDWKTGSWEQTIFFLFIIHLNGLLVSLLLINSVNKLELSLGAKMALAAFQQCSLKSDLGDMSLKILTGPTGSRRRKSVFILSLETRVSIVSSGGK